MLMSTLPTCILNQTAHIANRKNSAASRHRVPHLLCEWLTQITSWLALGQGSRQAVASYPGRQNWPNHPLSCR